MDKKHVESVLASVEKQTELMFDKLGISKTLKEPKIKTEKLDGIGPDALAKTLSNDDAKKKIENTIDKYAPSERSGSLSAEFHLLGPFCKRGSSVIHMNKPSKVMIYVKPGDQ